MRVLVTGFPYVRERYFATFRYWPDAVSISFLLPVVWTAKDGKVVFHPPRDHNVATTPAFFSHSHYPVIGGLLKGFMPGFAAHLWRNRRSVELVYACSEPTLLSTLYFALVSKILGKKFVCFTWENIPYEEKLSGLSLFVHTALLRLNLRLADGLICGNEAAAIIHRRYTNHPIAVMPMNGLDSEQFKLDPEARRHSGLVGKTVFTFIGAIGYRKGIHLILKALPKVLETVPNAYVVIAGSGEYEGEILRLMHEPLISGHVAHFPWIGQHEIIKLLSASDVFVYPSIPHKGWAEQFGYSMAEASLMELPVISTRSGSIADVVTDNQTGLLVPPDDVDQLAIAMVQLGKDESLRKRLGTAGRQYIMEQYSHQVVSRRFYEFFSGFVNRKSPSA